LLQVTVGAAYDSRSLLRTAWRSLSSSRAADNHPPAIAFSPLLHHEAAKVYYARGQIEQALRHWQRAEALGDPTIDSLACQAMLMAPSATYEGLRHAQETWASRHARPLAQLKAHRWRSYDGRRRIRVGYWSVYMNRDFMDVMLLHAIKRRDRDRFEVHGYSPVPVPPASQAAFD